MPEKRNNKLVQDVAIILISVLAAIDLAKSNTLAGILALTQESVILGGLLGGILFTSGFTAAPAVVVLGKLAQSYSVFPVAFLGAIGAVVGDLLIFRFLRDGISEDFANLMQQAPRTRFAHVFRLRLFRWFAAFLGALVVASPLPDEIGLFMMGISKLKLSRFIPLSFVLNFLGVVAIGLIARSLL